MGIWGSKIPWTGQGLKVVSYSRAGSQEPLILTESECIHVQISIIISKRALSCKIIIK